MSASSSQRVRKSPCSGSTKQGPMRATLPVSSLLRQQNNTSGGSAAATTQTSNNKQQQSNAANSTSQTPTDVHRSTSASQTTSSVACNAPPLSPTPGWRSATTSRISPDACSGQRSPGALASGPTRASSGYFSKSKTLSARGPDGCYLDASGNGHRLIRRTASLDTIYMQGQWPRDYLQTSLLLVDKATQVNIHCSILYCRAFSLSLSFFHNSVCLCVSLLCFTSRRTNGATPCRRFTVRDIRPRHRSPRSRLQPLIKP
ncbi:unnamed protein product [Trichogramma brassicae]|uniref:Uncharacterized protein n=1 Tax=Trichogramma brassicae TaxID=86971 RepID=A0A6H5HW15_9HYME|nr:unnamed protein product [Trichogramma brassicae]